MSNNVEVQRYTGDVLLKTIDEAKKIIEDIWLPEYKKYGYARWAVVYKAEKKIIGFAGLNYIVPEFSEYILRNAQGRIIRKGIIDTNSLQLNITEAPSGIYLLTLTNDFYLGYLKVIKI